MKKHDLKYALGVMLAALEGKEIERKHDEQESSWLPCSDEDLCWDWYSTDYRVKTITLEEAAEDYEDGISAPDYYAPELIEDAFIAGAVWQKEQDNGQKET